MQYVVAVRALCDFTAKQGDLDLRFTPSPTAREGIAGHQTVTARRGAGYESEITLQLAYLSLTVRGRADGYDPHRNQLEEIKTHRGDLARQPANHRHLHWAQVRIYGWLLCQARSLSEITLALVYFDIASQQETVLTEQVQADTLRVFFEQQCGKFLAWADQELAHRQRRDGALTLLRFPHASFRTGQRALAEGIYRSTRRGRCLMAQAPTGIGKTIGSLFPVLKACPEQALDKIFFLAAKTPGRQLALDALGLIGRGLNHPAQTDGATALPLRILELTARDKACEHPDKACHGDSCPLARGFYDRLPAARAAALTAGALDGARLRDVGLSHQVCPYYLSQELVRWADVVVGDYNYYFDSSALLHAMTIADDWRVSVLVDEAHNLVERARGMYTTELRRSVLQALRQSVPAVLARPLARLDRCWDDLEAAQLTAYQTHEELPDRFITALQQAAAAIADFLADTPAQPAGPLQQFYFDALAFTRLADAFGDHSLFDVTLSPGQSGAGPLDSMLCIRNLIPAPFLAPRFAAAQSVVLFSATLSPPDFYRNSLGVPADSAWIEVESPFQPEQLKVQLVGNISTRFPDRQRSVRPIVQLIAEQFKDEPGNYLAFFSSFDYLRMVASRFVESHPSIPVWEQARGMREPDRRRFLARFAPGGSGVGFAVLGGSFAEGIDLPGDRLIGAFIATLGLPQVNPVNEQAMARMEQAFGAGYDYTYLFPGIRKVVQAAGRVIRSREDRGVVYLIDDRFARPAVLALLPSWWRIGAAIDPA